MKLTTLLLATSTNNNINANKNTTSEILWKHLEEHGFVVLTVPKKSSAGDVIRVMQETLHNDLFPITTTTTTASNKCNNGTNKNAANLQSGSIYISERGVPMWKVGYEECDAIREAFRVHAGSPDAQPWPNHIVRRNWLAGMCLCRHVCDAALGLTLQYNSKSRHLHRPGSGVCSWRKSMNNNFDKDANQKLKRQSYHELPEGELPDRSGDYSVFYSMHYFNDEESRMARFGGQVTGSDDVRLNVKEHVDPSLFVLEPFLAEKEGLQVFNPVNKEWLTCDGPTSPIHDVVNTDDEIAMVLFVGRAFAEQSVSRGRNVQATLHRVVAGKDGIGGSDIYGHSHRRTVIYEQKYEEYFPEAALD